MTLIPRFFELVDKNKPASLLTIEPQSAAEKTIDQFLNTKRDPKTPEKWPEQWSTQLDRLEILLKNLPDPNCLEAPKLYEEYMNNKLAIEKLLQVFKIPENLTIQPHLPLEKLEQAKTIIQLFLKRNEDLVNSTLRFSEQELIKASDSATKLLEKVKPNQLENWSQVTDALYERIDKNRHAKKMSRELFNQDKLEIEKEINKITEYLRKIPPTNDEKPSPLKPR